MRSTKVNIFSISFPAHWKPREERPDDGKGSWGGEQPNSKNTTTIRRNDGVKFELAEVIEKQTGWMHATSQSMWICVSTVDDARCGTIFIEYFTCADSFGASLESKLIDMVHRCALHGQDK